MRKIVSMILLWCMIASLCVIPVHADSYCCTLSVDSVVCQNGKVTVNYTTYSAEADREVEIGVMWERNGNGTRILREDITVPAGEYSDFIEFDDVNFISGQSYRIDMRFKNRCASNECQWRCYENFFLESGGMPVYELSNTYSEEVTVGKTPIAVKISAAKSGIYKLFIDCEDWMAVDTSTSNTLVYLKQGDTYYFQLTSNYSETSSTQSFPAKFKADLADITTQTVLNANPEDNDTVFSITDLGWEGVAKLEIPKSGIYEIFTSCEDDGNIVLLNADGEEVVWQEYGMSGSYILDAGTYYYIAEPWSMESEYDEATDSYYWKYASYTTTMKYNKIPNLTFGDEINSESYNDQYLSFTLNNPAVIQSETVSGWISFQAEGEGKTYYISEQPTVLPAGEYILTYNGEGSAKVTQTAVPVVEIGNEISYYEHNSDKYVALKAPETAEYEIAILNTTLSPKINDEYVEIGYHYKKMQAGEILIVTLYDTEAMLSAKKYQMTYTPVSLGTNDVNFAHGKKARFSFTADADDIYLISLTKPGYADPRFENIKIFTEDEVLYEEEGVYVAPLEVSLKKNDTVYIDGFDSDCEVIRISKLTISGDTDVECVQAEGVQKNLIYLPAEAGYYDFKAIRTSGDESNPIYVSANGKDIGTVRYETAEVSTSALYVSRDNPLRITLSIGGSNTVNIKLTFQKVESKSVADMSNFEIADDAYYSLKFSEAGIYCITGSAYCEANDWQSAGTFAYGFSPIIKNGETKTSGYDMSYISYDDEVWPTYFYANAGDEILLQETLTSSWRNYQYPITASVSKVDVTEASLDTYTETDEKTKIYSITIPKKGNYRFEDLSDSGIVQGHGYTIFYNGEIWKNIDGELVLELEAGTYYVFAGTYDWDEEDTYVPKAGFKMAKIKTELSAVKADKSVSYSITGSVAENASLYLALYDGKILKEVRAVKNPDSQGSITFEDSIKAYQCKLFLWNETLEPLCQSVVTEAQ